MTKSISPVSSIGSKALFAGSGTTSIITPGASRAMYWISRGKIKNSTKSPEAMRNLRCAAAGKNGVEPCRTSSRRLNASRTGPMHD
ncbi:hypothetical protein D3C85_1492060 [compost metagenome]